MVSISSVKVDCVLDHTQASSGVSVDQNCLAVYNDLKLKKMYKYVTYKLNPGFTQIVVDKTSEDKDYESFLADLPQDEPRWAVYDFEFTKEGAGVRNKLLFYSWCASYEIQNPSAVTPERAFHLV